MAVGFSDGGVRLVCGIGEWRFIGDVGVPVSVPQGQTCEW